MIVKVLSDSGGGGTLKIVTIASSNSQQARDFDVKSLLPNYQDLTIDNFFIKNATIRVTTAYASRLNNIISSYNPLTGVLSCNSCAYSGSAQEGYVEYTIVAMYKE